MESHAEGRGDCCFAFSVLAYTAPSLKAVQAKSPTVSSHTYKKIKELKYPQVHHIGNAAFEKKINQELKAYIEQSYQEYLKNKKQASSRDSKQNIKHPSASNTMRRASSAFKHSIISIQAAPMV